MRTTYLRAAASTLLAIVAACSDGVVEPRLAPDGIAADKGSGSGGSGVDQQLRAALSQHGFTGRVGSTLEARLGRRVDRRVAEIGRQLWFDPIMGLNDDNSCAGCHSPTHGFGDTQSIAIGIDNNFIVGPRRTGPRNQRRTPMAINTAFSPTLMWNSRFHAVSRDPFDNRRGFSFPLPEGSSLSGMQHLLQAQAFIPPTERNEAAGFTKPGDNAAIRDSVVRRLRGNAAYWRLFTEAFPDAARTGRIDYAQVARAIAEFEFTLVFANAPIDRFARGEGGMADDQKRGAVLFFGKAGCVTCHAVGGDANEMFSDFRQHVAGIPQIAPARTNSVFDGAGLNEDFGLEQVTGRLDDRYLFRTSPLRNVALQPAFMHDGAFVRLEDAIRYHLDAAGSGPSYRPTALAADLRGPTGPIAPVLARLDARLRTPLRLTSDEVADLVAFVRDGLLDPDARPDKLRGLVPNQPLSGRRAMTFEFPGR